MSWAESSLPEVVGEVAFDAPEVVSIARTTSTLGRADDANRIIFGNQGLFDQLEDQYIS